MSFAFDINKLLVPTPPIYDSLATVPGPENIISGKDPNVGVLQGILQSFSDAPGGFKKSLMSYVFCGS